MAQMCITPAAENFLTHHTVAGIPFNFDLRFVHRSIEAWPPGAGMKLGFRGEKRLPAPDTHMGPPRFGIFILAGAGRFGALTSGHLVLFGCQYLSPLGFCFSN